MSTSLCGTLAKRENNFMGNVVIAGNLKHTRDRIDPAGNIINARTKEIIKPIEPEYVPPVSQETPIENKVGSKIDEMINKKIEELVAKKIEEALSKS